MKVARSVPLDVLRGVAILLVLVTHPPIKLDRAHPWASVAYAGHLAGYTGVDLFFVLSGFLVGGLLFAELEGRGRLDVKRFLIRRGFKIWPGYYVYLVVLSMITLRGGGSITLLAPFLGHLQNYLGRIDLIGPHTWSLAVEEHFYLVLPFVLPFAFPKGRVGASGLRVAGLAIVCAILRAVDGGEPPQFLTHLRIDSLAFGVWLAHAFHQERAAFARVGQHTTLLLTGGTVLVVLAVAPGVLTGRLASAFTPVLLTLGYAAILVAAVEAPAAAWTHHWPARGLAFIGFYSYSIYLWHIDIAYRLIAAPPVVALVKSLPELVGWPLGMTVYAGLAVGTGVLMGRAIEQPSLALRDRLFPRQT